MAALVAPIHGRMFFLQVAKFWRVHFCPPYTATPGVDMTVCLHSETPLIAKVISAQGIRSA